MIPTSWLGKQPYQTVLRKQERQRDLVRDDMANERIFALEHDHVITSACTSGSGAGVLVSSISIVYRWVLN